MKITKILLTMEESARRYFEKVPFLQAFIAGVGVIIFWRGVWELLDDMRVSPTLSIVLGCLLLAGVGVFLQTFIGNTIIIKNVHQEEKTEQKELHKLEGHVKVEEVTLAELSRKLDALAEKIDKK
jgi:hypothetical protein